jgi:hypothetical protein
MVLKAKKMNEVILHVGLHKTGTSSIQETLFSEINNKLLEEKDYLYPISWYSNHSIPIYSAFCDDPEGYYENSRKGYSIAEIKNINERYLEGLETELTEREQSKLIISGEDISLLSVVNLNALKTYLMSLSINDVTIKVMIYVRNPVPWSISAIQEKIKGGQTYQYAFQYMLTNVENIFTETIDKFVQVFGKGNINVYSFEEAVAHKYGLVGHFLSSLGFIDSEISKFYAIRANESISQIAVDLLSFINEQVPIMKDGKLHEKRTDGDIIALLDIRGPKFDIPFSDKKKLFESSQEDIKWLKEHYGIDYSNLIAPETNNINYEFTEETIRDIKMAYFSTWLSPTLRSMVIDFLQQQLKANLNENSKLMLNTLLDELGS